MVATTPPPTGSGLSDDELRVFYAAYVRMATELGYADTTTGLVPAPHELTDPLKVALDVAGEHNNCPALCEGCGERLADMVCEHCNGSGCGPGTALGAYEECVHCAGARKAHSGCSGQTYAELYAEVSRLRAVVSATTKAAVHDAALNHGDRLRKIITALGGPVQ